MQKANLFLVKLLLAGFAILPFRLLYFLSDGLSFLFFYVIKYRRKVVRENLRKCFPEKHSDELKTIEKKYYRHLTDLLLESIRGLSLPKAALARRFRYLNPEIFPPGQSAILLGSHFGNWEWGSLSFPLAIEHEVMGIYKPLSDKVLEKYLNTRRTRWGLHLSPMNRAGRAVVEQRGRPSIFVLIADQTPSDVKNAHWLDFLNRDTPFLHGADKLARRTGYPVFYFEIEKVRRGFYEVTFLQICGADEHLADGQITARYAAALENTIRQRPEHWLWSHRRWKRKRPLSA